MNTTNKPVDKKDYIIGDFYTISLGNEIDSDFTKVIKLVNIRNTLSVVVVWFDLYGNGDETVVYKDRIKKHHTREEYPEYYL